MNKIKSFVCTLLRIYTFCISSSLFIHQISQTTLISIFLYVSLSEMLAVMLWCAFHGKRSVALATNMFFSVVYMRGIKIAIIKNLLSAELWMLFYSLFIGKCLYPFWWDYYCSIRLDGWLFRIATGFLERKR